MNYQTDNIQLDMPALPNVPVPEIPGVEAQQAVNPPLVSDAVANPLNPPITFAPEMPQGEPVAPFPGETALAPDGSQAQVISPAQYQQEVGYAQPPIESQYNPEAIPTIPSQTPPIEPPAVIPSAQPVAPLPQTLTTQTPVLDSNNAVALEVKPVPQTLPQQTQIIDIPFGEGEMFVSNSRLEGVAKCALMSALKLLKYRSKKAQPVPESGTAIHEGIYEFLRTGDVEKARAVVTAYYQPVVERAHDVMPAYELHNILAIVSEYCDRNKARVWPWAYEPAGIEVGFEAPLYGKVKVRGLIDILVRDKATQQIAFVDIKSTGRLDANKENMWAASTQFAQYTHAIKEIYDTEVYGGYVEAVQVFKLPTDKKKCKLHGVSYHKCSEKHANFRTIPVPQNAQKLANWKMTAIGLAQKLWALKKIVKDTSCLDQIPNQGMFNMSCQFCDFKDYCQLGRQQRVLDTEYEITSYDPFEGRPMIRAGEGK